MVETEEDKSMLLQLLSVPMLRRQSEVQDVQLCRICFATDGHLNTMTADKDLCQAYGAFTGLLMENDDSVPPYLCIECSRQLLLCTNFRNKTLQSHLILLEMLRKHDNITIEMIKTIRENQDGQISSFIPNNSVDLFGPETIQIKEETIFGNEQIYQNDPVNSLGDTALGIKKENNHVRQDGSEDDNLSVSNLYDNIMVHVGVKLERDDYNEERHDISNAFNDDGCTMQDEMFESEDLSSDILREQIEAGLNVADVEEQTKHNRYTRRKRKCGDTLIIYDKLCCDKCSYKTISDVKMLSHLQTHSLDTRNVNNNISNKQEEDSKLISSFLCHVCNKTFSSICNLHKHMKTHSDIKPFKCDVCTKGFCERRDLQNHLRTHSGEKPFSCDLCKKSFSERGNLLRHIRIHSGVKPFSCKICRRSFNQRHHLTRHMKKHNKV